MQIESSITVHLPRQEEQMNEMLIFILKLLLGIQLTYSSEFSISQSTSETFLMTFCEAEPFYFVKRLPRPQIKKQK